MIPQVGRHVLAPAFSFGLVALSLTSAAAATLPPGFSETVLASGLAAPTAIAIAPDGRIFVCLQGGHVRVIKNGALLPTPFVSVSVNATGERGLLGVAFDPGFESNGFVYVYYTATTPTIHNRVSRFTANGDVAAAGSELVLLDLNPLSAANNHNGGALHFGADGKLYIAVGDNADGTNSQNLNNLLGKILRINSDGSIPADNPFFSQTTGTNRAIWALGLRNPFTFSVHAGSGRVFINDVGQDAWEEVNEGVAGANYGWPSTEGPTTNPSFRGPLYAYGHGTGGFLGCAITGGAFYHGVPAQFPADYMDAYFFADYCGGWINRIDQNGSTPTAFASGIASPIDLAVGPEGSLYYLARGPFGGTGSVVRVAYTGSQAPAITQQPASQTVSVGQSATFTVAASGSQPLAYQWQRNGANIASATSPTYTFSSAQLSDSGSQFRCVVSNGSGNAMSNAAVLTVVSNRAPTVTIVAPAAGTLYAAGTTIAYSGTASDPEDGSVPASRMTWEVVFHHDAHTHPFIGPTSGAASGSFTIPNTGETAWNVWYRIHFKATDSAGQQSATFRDVRPRLVTVTLATNPTGLQLTLDGQPITGPFTFTSVVGMRRTIGAPSPQVGGGSTYEFRSWSDRGGQTHTITTPTSTATITASYWKRKGR